MSPKKEGDNTAVWVVGGLAAAFLLFGKGDSIIGSVQEKIGEFVTNTFESVKDRASDLLKDISTGFGGGGGWPLGDGGDGGDGIFDGGGGGDGGRGVGEVIGAFGRGAIGAGARYSLYAKPAITGRSARFTGTVLKIEEALRLPSVKDAVRIQTATKAAAATRAAKPGVTAATRIVPRAVGPTARLSSRATLRGIPILGQALLGVDVGADLLRFAGVNVTEWLGISGLAEPFMGYNPIEAIYRPGGAGLPIQAEAAQIKSYGGYPTQMGARIRPEFKYIYEEPAQLYKSFDLKPPITSPAFPGMVAGAGLPAPIVTGASSLAGLGAVWLGR